MTRPSDTAIGMQVRAMHEATGNRLAIDEDCPLRRSYRYRQGSTCDCTAVQIRLPKP